MTYVHKKIPGTAGDFFIGVSVCYRYFRNTSTSSVLVMGIPMTLL
jgi:hypothetical protein